jgi:hypothetical protein
MSQIEKRPMGHHLLRGRLWSAINKYAENYSKDKIHEESLQELCTVLDEVDLVFLENENFKNTSDEV